MAAIVPVPVVDDLTSPGAQQSRPGLRASQSRRLNAFRYLVFALAAVFFGLPMFALFRMSLLGSRPGTYSFAAWKQIGTYPGLLGSIELSLEISVITFALMILLLLPTMMWTRLRVPRFGRTLEFLCLLPLAIPAIVLVVGWAPEYNRIERFNLSGIMLIWAYVILVLPYTYRALSAGLNAIDVPTLSEAARSLGASWATVMTRIIAPNMWQAILNAALLSMSLTLGEFTVAYILGYNTFSVKLVSISRNSNNPVVVFAASAAGLLFTFLLLLILSYVGRRRRRRRA
ncbi:MAG: ABC transporter permease subunit [Actinomycetota bacterium]|nr:ABC transporter permease subunit [Actinomycetota bacterium]